MANFELITELQTLLRRDFAVATVGQLNPLNANPIVDGEWLVLDANYALARGTGEGTDPNVFPVHTEKGRYDTQAIGKANVLFLGMYEAESAVYDSAALVLGGALTVQDVTFQSLTRRGLKLDASGANRVRVGFVTKVLSNSKVRFIHFGNQKM